MQNIALTIDVEQDVPPYLNTWKGMEEGLPALLDLLSKHDIRATFFVTGQAAERFPELIKKVSRKHEVACHGYRHERLDKLNRDEQFKRIALATKILADVTNQKILGFRAPNFKPNAYTFEILERLNYVYDSSCASYKICKNPHKSKIIEIPNTLPSSFLRLPTWLSTHILQLCSTALTLTVLDFHVWEVTQVFGVRFDCRFSTGETALRRLDLLLGRSRAKGAKFVMMREVAVRG
jgi:hypothetical protein